MSGSLLCDTRMRGGPRLTRTWAGQHWIHVRSSVSTCATCRTGTTKRELPSQSSSLLKHDHFRAIAVAPRFMDKKTASDAGEKAWIRCTRSECVRCGFMEVVQLSYAYPCGYGFAPHTHRHLQSPRCMHAIQPIGCGLH